MKKKGYDVDKIISRFSEENLKHEKSSFSRKIIFWQSFISFSYSLKRFLDLILSLAGIILLSPVLVITAFAIILEDPGPIIYSQSRVGKDGKLFYFFKFRSMIVNADHLKEALLKNNESKDGVIFKMKHDPRITKVGRFIRKYSIDELPQLINVLKGDMSMVGPRPPLPKEVNQYTLEDRKRLHIKPGITCIWQVEGRSDIPFKEQVELDKEYIRSQSLWSDLKILLKTIPAVITGKGAY
ncbi:MAG: exopolysaccharide biosynthesis polyprenyl glycosylphosphotransferase [Candidatus Cloacimonetes bacterium]|nr:exopolysaccharide biosynthesis polyprenyl glycosylphosphotransferase [Candidatus Cloacimonadota bacterium]